MSAYRCLGCREYHTRPEHKRIGLGSVCSEKCEATARKPKPAKRAPSGPTAATRGTVSVRDKGRCRFCGGTGSLHDHHVEYRSQGGSHTESNLITLCQEHHDLVHSDKRRWQPVCKAYVEQADLGRYRFLPEIDCEINGEPVEG